MLLETNIDGRRGILRFAWISYSNRTAWVTVVMKEGRATHTLHCLCREDQTDVLLPVVFRHSTPRSVSGLVIDRVALERKMFTNYKQSRYGATEGLWMWVGYLGAEVSVGQSSSTTVRKPTLRRLVFRSSR
jgi:hypothetical protein